VGRALRPARSFRIFYVADPREKGRPAGTRAWIPSPCAATSGDSSSPIHLPPCASRRAGDMQPVRPRPIHAWSFYPRLPPLLPRQSQSLSLCCSCSHGVCVSVVVALCSVAVAVCAAPASASALSVVAVAVARFLSQKKKITATALPISSPTHRAPFLSSTPPPTSHSQSSPTPACRPAAVHRCTLKKKKKKKKVLAGKASPPRYLAPVFVRR